MRCGWRCPVHGIGRGPRRHRRRLADQQAANHIAWASWVKAGGTVVER